MNGFEEILRLFTVLLIGTVAAPKPKDICRALGRRRLHIPSPNLMANDKPSPAAHDIARSIVALRGQRVILDSPLAAIYGVPTKALNQAVKRNSDRFPDDFRFRLTSVEVAASRSQFVTLKPCRGSNTKFLPYAFTEHGAIQAANVLNSPRAIAMGVYVVRAFVQLRELVSTNKELAHRFEQLEARLDKKYAQHDEAIAAILAAIRQLMSPPTPNRRSIGFTANIGTDSS